MLSNKLIKKLNYFKINSLIGIFKSLNFVSYNLHYQLVLLIINKLKIMLILFKKKIIKSNNLKTPSKKKILISKNSNRKSLFSNNN
jgi:hypothetical protein